MASKKSVVPFGPQHPVLPEPIHLDLVLDDEKVVEAIPSIGFVHRGLESLVKKKDFKEMQYVVERTCGICSFMHGMTYCETIEHIMDVEVPVRGRYLRTIWCEMSRLHSHMLWLGLLADAFGFESLFYQCWRMREQILDMFEASTGGRVIFSVNAPGGVLKDMPSDMLHAFVEKLDGFETELHKIADIFLNAILLLCYKKDADTIDLIQKIIESYNRDKNQSVSISGTALDIYIEILKELMSDEVDLHDKRALNTLLLKFLIVSLQSMELLKQYLK